ncbi:MAG: PorT family protein [Crocinitomicaceae bacterium]|nr:PorT family protein [Crocinitomicaceae bacterium]
MTDQNNIIPPDDHFIPPGLEYRKEYWEKAFEKIIAHEAAERRHRRKIFYFSLSALLLIAASVITFNNFSSPVTAELSKHESKLIPVNMSSTDEKLSGEVVDSMIKENIPVGSVHSDIVTKERTTPPNDRSNLTMEIRHNTHANSIDPMAAMEKNYTTKEEEISPVNFEKENINLVKNDLVMSEPSLTTATKEKAEIQRITPLPVPANGNNDLNKLTDCSTISSLENEALPHWNLSASTGISVLTDFSTPLRDLTYDPSLSLNIERNWNNRFSTTTGLEYFSISKVRSPYSQTSVSYDINYKKTVTTVETHRLHYLSLPVRLYYRPGAKHQFQVGMGISYMITGTNEISEYLQTSSEDTLLNRYDDNGFVSGFRDLSVHAEVGYSYRIIRKVWLGTSFQFGLTDITRNNYFGNDAFNRNSRLLLYLKMNFK